SVMWDASVLPDGEAAIAALAAMGPALEFMRDQYRHCKPILVNTAGSVLLAKAGIPVMLPDGSADPGIIGSAKSNAKRSAKSPGNNVSAFIEAMAAHRHFEREMDPPPV
ncbi:MAG: catalase HPII, partial [Phycisphaerae bacterium]|nr:catalase HPII [Gemmatimonadaceae bacterium]